ncbi:MAG: hypothetical protein O3A33_03200 [Chloroflexi bacterium]|nr:hypothetical protein [Chloroflexota bacterium]
MNTLNLTRAYMSCAVALLLLCGCAQLGIYRLELLALPQEGPAPLTVSFAASITGGLDISPELYCQQQTWDFGDGRRVGVFGLCQSLRPGRKIDRQFGQYYPQSVMLDDQPCLLHPGRGILPAWP